MKVEQDNYTQLSPWRRKMHEIIFEADTTAGKLFDVVLLVMIVISIVTVMLESVVPIQQKFGVELNIIEWVLTVLFTLEYLARILSVGKPLKYVFSFYGLVDLVSIIPTYLGLFVTGTQTLATVRSIRLLRVFRILKMARFLKEASTLRRALVTARPKIIVFLVAVFSIVVIMGTVMYMIEDPKDGFTSIPRSIYWAIVTLTTVGYGDIAPQTVLGQFFASVIMVIGYAIIAVPTGIVSAEIAKTPGSEKVSTQACPSCSKDGHEHDAEYCKYCGSILNQHGDS